jgi:branched-chain amino acid aminotransferase
MSIALPQFVEVDGRVLPATRPSISAFDRGLLYGDGLFETLRAYRGKPFALAQHLRRLETSARFLGIVLPRRAWQRSILKLLQRNRLGKTDAWVRITITRGVGPPGPLPVARLHPTVVIAAGRLDPAIATAQRRGVRVALLPFARHDVLAEHKALNYLSSVLGKVLAARHRAYEGFFVDEEGCITEGTTSNVLVRRRGRLCTPPLAGILPGVTRKFVLQIAAGDGVHVIEQALKVADLLDADEAFLTSSLAEVVPVIAVDNRPVGNGMVGPLTRRLQDLYRQKVDRALGQSARTFNGSPGK